MHECYYYDINSQYQYMEVPRFCTCLVSRCHDYCCSKGGVSADGGFIDEYCLVFVSLELDLLKQGGSLNVKSVTLIG